MISSRAGFGMIAGVGCIAICAALTCPTTVGTGCYDTVACQNITQSQPPPYCYCSSCPAIRFLTGTPGKKYNSPTTATLNCDERRQSVPPDCDSSTCVNGTIISTWTQVGIVSVVPGTLCGQPEP